VDSKVLEYEVVEDCIYMRSNLFQQTLMAFIWLCSDCADLWFRLCYIYGFRVRVS